jgi:hypothetical protein
MDEASIRKELPRLARTSEMALRAEAAFVRALGDVDTAKQIEDAAEAASMRVMRYAAPSAIVTNRSAEIQAPISPAVADVPRMYLLTERGSAHTVK